MNEVFWCQFSDKKNQFLITKYSRCKYSKSSLSQIMCIFSDSNKKVYFIKILVNIIKFSFRNLEESKLIDNGTDNSLYLCITPVLHLLRSKT